MTNQNDLCDQSQAAETGHFSHALDALAGSMSREGMSLGEITQFMERRTIGALLLLFALPMVIPIPAPGISVAFGIPLVLISAQLFLGRPRAWLPGRLARRQIARETLLRLISSAGPWLRGLERIARPRFEWLVDGQATYVSGAACVAMAIIITLPIPLGHFVPGGAVSLIAVGLMERDGLLIAAGLLVSVVALCVITVASTALMGFIQTTFPGV